MENPFAISKINDFVFCPVSIYFHSLDEDTEKLLYQTSYQLDGIKAHESIDNKKYSDKVNILQAIDVYSEKYNLIGKIDIFDKNSGILAERKNKIKQIYDGYIYQIYAEYLCLKEMGYCIKELRLYSMNDNKVYIIKKPEEDAVMLNKFNNVLKEIEEFNFENFVAINEFKCKNCIYEELCSYSILK